MDRQRVYTNSPWEKDIGYCRALRAGNHVVVSGTGPLDPDGSVHAPGNAYAQTRRSLEIALGALAKLGAGPRDVVRSRIYVTHIARWEEIGRAHAEVFADHPPVTTMVEVRALIDPLMMVEIELEALVG